MRRSTRLLVAVGVAAGLVVTAGGVASAKGKPTPGSATGTVTCSVQAALVFNPPLQASATGNSTVSLQANLVRCSKASGSHRRVTGHVHIGNLGSIPSNTCTAPTSAPTFSGGMVRWTPPSQVAGSSVSAGTAGTVTTLTNGDGQVAYTGLTVTGSFATTSGTLTAQTKDTVADLVAACKAGGLDAIGLGGHATL